MATSLLSLKLIMPAYLLKNQRQHIHKNVLPKAIITLKALEILCFV